LAMCPISADTPPCEAESIIATLAVK